MGRSEIRENQVNDQDFLSEAEFDAAKESVLLPGKAGIGTAGSSPDISRRDHIHLINNHADLANISATDHHSNVNDPSTSQKAAMDAAATPSGANAFATIADIPSGGVTAPIRIPHSFASTGAKVDSSIFVVKNRFVFEGTTISGAPTAFRTLYTQNSTFFINGNTTEVRLFDITNGLQIALITIPPVFPGPSVIPVTKNTLVFTNLPVGQATWQVEARTDFNTANLNPSNFRIYESMILF